MTSGNLKLASSCQELQYPYVIQLKVGTGQVYGTTAIDNMDWSTFFGGGNGDDFGYGLAVDSDKNLYACGDFKSNNFPNAPGPYANFDPNISRQGVVAKFDKNTLELLWITALTFSKSVIKTIGTFDNLSGSGAGGDEIHFVGETFGDLTSSSQGSNFTSLLFNGDFTKTSTNPKDLMYGTLLNNGTMILMTPFGGDGIEEVFGMDIRANQSGEGIMYFTGSTDHGSVAAASHQREPGDKSSAYELNFPVYDPNDGSIFTAVHPSAGNQRGFITAVNLDDDYILEYSSLLTDYKEVHDIVLGSSAAYCGAGLSGARIGRFNPGSKMLDNNLTSSNSTFNHLDYFSSVVLTGNGHIFYGLNETKTNSLMTSVTLPQYQNDKGESYFMRLGSSANTPAWDSYFGQVSDVGSEADQVNIWEAKLLSVRRRAPGSIAFNPSLNTAFATGSFKTNIVETRPKTGFFRESSIANNPGTAGSEIYLAAMVNNQNIQNNYSWGTIYGGGDHDVTTDVISYNHNNKSYVVVIGYSESQTGTTTSDIEKYPVADIGLTKSYFQANNRKTGTNKFSDFVITRFEVDGVDQNLSLDDLASKYPDIRIYPNPFVNEVSIYSGEEDIEEVSVYNSSGQCVLEKRSFGQVDGSGVHSVDLSFLPKGIYILNFNNHYNVKIIKA